MTPASSAERVRRYRDRRRRGLVPVQIALYEREIEELVKRQFLDQYEIDNRRAIGKAVGKLLDKVLR